MLALPAPERHDDLDQAFDEDLTNIVDRIDLRGPTFYNVTYKGEEPYLTRVCKYLFAQLIEDISGEIIENAYKEEKLGAVMTLEDASRRYTEKLLKKAIWITHTALFLALNETWIRELLVRISVYSSLRNRIRTIVRYETSRCLYVVQEKVINEMWETDLMIVLRGVVNKTIVRTDMCSNIVEKLWRTVFNSKRKGLRDLGVEDRRKEGPQLHLDFELSEIEIGDLDKKRRKRMYAAIALDYFSNVLVGVIFHQSGGIPTMQIDPRKLGVMAGKVVSTVGYKRSVSGYVRDAFGDLQRSEFVVDFGGHRIMFLVVSVEVVKTLRDLSKKQIYAMPSSLRIDTKKRKRLNAKEKEKKKFLREESLLNAAAYVSSFIEVVFEDELLKAHTTAHIDRLSKETLRVATTHQIRLTCTKKYVERLAEKVSDHVFTEISMGVLLEIVNEISRRDIARLIRGVAYSMLNDVVCQEVDIQTTHATLNEAIEYDVVYGIFSCSFERECLSIELYRDIFLDIFKEQCLETLLSAQAAKLFDEIQLQKRMLEVAFPSPEAFTSRSLVNRYWLQAMAHQIAKSLVNGEIVTEMQLTLAYKQTMEQEVRKKQEHQLIQDSIEKIVRTHGKQVWVEETTKALARIHQQILIETITEYYYLLTEVMHELAGLAMDKALVHFILYVRPVLEMIQQEVERERKKYKTRFGNLVAGVATNFLETELYYLMKNCAYQAAVGPDPAVKPTPIVPDLAYLLAFDSLNITDVVSQHPIPPTTLACRKRVMRVCFDFRPEAIRRQKARSLFMKRAEERANFCWGKLHRHFIQHKFLKADPKDNGFDIFVMNTMSQAAIRIMREHKFEILQERYLPLFIKHVSMFIYGELIVTCGNNESFENLKKQYPGKELAHLFRRNWDRAVLEEGDVYLDFVNWVRGFNKPIQKERFPESQVVKRMKNPAAGRQRLAGGLKDVHASPRTEPTSNGNESSAGRSGSCRRVLRSPTDSTRSGAFAREEIDGEMRLRLEAIRGEYNSIEMTKQDMELPFVRKLVKKLPKMVAYRPGRKIPLEEASSSCEDSESCKGESDSSSGSSSLSGSSSSGLEESSEESEKDEDVSTKSSISGLDGVTQNRSQTVSKASLRSPQSNGNPQDRLRAPARKASPSANFRVGRSWWTPFPSIRLPLHPPLARPPHSNLNPFAQPSLRSQPPFSVISLISGATERVIFMGATSRNDI
ncbi:hypothetical protein L596_014188 [Steinernema carpocapsae]|uniref:Uncharacterized protein n=1 Tax=Steinernema carpocapsae TaxID=34508 RepID=A0A4U5NBQ6_STECR|nr:hypothetical protein L596_014188 [Steinernema carpocapsae]